MGMAGGWAGGWVCGWVGSDLTTYPGGQRGALGATPS